MAEHSAMRVEQVGLWLRRAIKGIVMLRQTSKATTRIAARSKENPALAQLRPEADTAGRWPAGRAGSSTHKNEGRHAARHPLAPLFAARTWQASRRVGFGTWALAVQLRPKPLAGQKIGREAKSRGRSELARSQHSAFRSGKHRLSGAETRKTLDRMTFTTHIGK
jgi:hypothetical protein